MNAIIIFALLGCFVYVWLMLSYIGSLLGFRVEKYKLIAQVLTSTISVIYAYISIYHIPVPIIYILAFIILLLLFHLMLNGTWLQHTFASSNIIFHIISSRGIILSVISLLYGQNLYTVIRNDFLHYLSIGLSFFACFLYLIFFSYRLYPLKEIVSVGQKREYLTIMTVSQGFLNNLLLFGDTVYSFKEAPNWFSLYHLFAYILIFTTFYILFNFCVKSSTLQKYKSAYRLYEQQLQKQVKAYTVQAEYTQRMREFRHDWNHIKETLHPLIETGKKEDILRFLDEIDVTIHDLSGNYKEYSGNPLIQAILLHTNLLCQKQDIDFEASAILPESIPLNAFDLCRVFTNITNNALEANENLHSRHKYIRIMTAASEHWCTITCVNSFNGILKKVNGEYHTLKNDSHSHGFGLKHIEEILEACGGFVKIHANTESGTFKIRMHIPILSQCSLHA